MNGRGAWFRWIVAITAGVFACVAVESAKQGRLWRAVGALCIYLIGSAAVLRSNRSWW